MLSLMQKIEKLAKSLPINNLISSSGVQAELRWEKTKNWNLHCGRKESEVIQVQIDDVGKLLV